MNRLEACERFFAENPDFVYGHAHAVIEDGNIESYFIYGAIVRIAMDLVNERSEFDMPVEQAHIALKFLVGLLDLPQPSG